MRLQHLVLGLCALALTASLASPANAQQTFWTYSTAPVQTPKPTPTYPIGIDYLYNPCAPYPNGSGRFNPYDMRANSSGCYHGKPPPHHRKPAPPPRRIPLARHT